MPNVYTLIVRKDEEGSSLIVAFTRNNLPDITPYSVLNNKPLSSIVNTLFRIRHRGRARPLYCPHRVQSWQLEAAVLGTQLGQLVEDNKLVVHSALGAEL